MIVLTIADLICVSTDKIHCHFIHYYYYTYIQEFESASITLEDNKRVIDKLTEDTRLSRSQNIELSAQLKESKAVIQKHLKEYEALFTKSSKVCI